MSIRSQPSTSLSSLVSLGSGGGPKSNSVIIKAADDQIPLSSLASAYIDTPSSFNKYSAYSFLLCSSSSVPNQINAIILSCSTAMASSLWTPPDFINFRPVSLRTLSFKFIKISILVSSSYDSVQLKAPLFIKPASLYISRIIFSSSFFLSISASFWILLLNSFSRSFFTLALILSSSSLVRGSIPASFLASFWALTASSSNCLAAPPI